MMLRSIAKLFLLCLLGLAVAGCGKSGSSGSNSAHVRFMNAVVDAGPLNITVGTKSVVTGLAFEGLTTYQETDSGTQEYKVSVAGGTSTIIDTSLSLSGDAQYTYVVYGTASAPISVIVADASTDPGSGLFFLRVSNAAFGNAALDVYVTTPGAPLDNASPNISNILLGASSSFTQLTPGALQVRMTLRNSKQVIYDAGTLTFNERTSYYMVAYTKGSSTLVNAALLNIDSTGSGSVVNSKIAQFKVIHAAPGTAAINAFVDGTVAFANIPYQGASSYSALPAGTHAVTFQTVTSPGAVIASAQPALAAATDTSIVVTGAPGAQTAVVLPDNNLPGTTGSARVRFVNVAPNLGPVDVYVNFAPRALALGSNAASGYVALVEDTYAINFDLSGTTTVVLNMPTVPVNAGHSYTIYLVGTTGQLAGVVTRDN